MVLRKQEEERKEWEVERWCLEGEVLTLQRILRGRTRRWRSRGRVLGVLVEYLFNIFVIFLIIVFYLINLLCLLFCFNICFYSIN